jgi:hypothetical protein
VAAMTMNAIYRPPKTAYFGDPKVPNMKLTKAAVMGLQAPHPSGKQTLIWDTRLKGFGVLVSGVTPAKSYVVQHGLRDPEQITSADIIICATHKTRHYFNTKARRARRITGPYPVVGEPVICLRNDHQRQIYNGSGRRGRRGIG